MAQSYRPPKPTGNSRFVLFCQSIWEYLFNGGFPFIDTDTVKVERGPSGYAFKAYLPTAGGGKGKTLDANYKVMVITSLGSSLAPANYDLLICREWDMNTSTFKSGAADVYVAKDVDSRRVIDKEFYYDNNDNITQTYSYFTPTQSDASYGDNFRLANDGTNSELQAMEKRYYTKDMLINKLVSARQAILYVVDTGVPTGVKDPSGKDVTQIEVKPFRAWIRYATQ